MYQVFVIKEGYQYSEVGGEENASGTVTFVNGPHKIIVDTGNPWDKEDIIQGLAKHAVLPSDIDYVVCTHGHLDHVGNLNLFTNAIYIVSYDICIRNRYLMHDFKEVICLNVRKILKNPICGNSRVKSQSPKNSTELIF
ncbi:Hypothetical predicted protein [Octopus vulgaris]|nr:Hypothetical predicted protein [Octopus vulgaris]